MSTADVPLIECRRIEAATLVAVYNELLQSKSERFALDTIARTVSALAFAKGRAFAAQAPAQDMGGAPSLRHFATIVDVWNGTGALQIENVHQSAHELAFSVTRCAYAELYRSMQVPAALVPVLSCSRDAPFARGYSPHLHFFREQTIAEGAEYCDFLFRWE